ncbi:MAG: DUF3126 family protein [Pseudomonadota bacterium]|nr:DUF3126 family protein [Pseudomonadota bacterium]
MNRNEVARVQSYLRRTFGNNGIEIDMPEKPGQPVEIRVGSEFIGVLYRDDEEGEISYSMMMSILEEDLPPEVPR